MLPQYHKKCMNYGGACKFLYKKTFIKTLKKYRVYRNKKLGIVYYYSLK